VDRGYVRITSCSDYFLSLFQRFKECIRIFHRNLGRGLVPILDILKRIGHDSRVGAINSGNKVMVGRWEEVTRGKGVARGLEFNTAKDQSWQYQLYSHVITRIFVVYNHVKIQKTLYCKGTR
jgi:hypothetical protein